MNSWLPPPNKLTVNNNYVHIWSINLNQPKNIVIKLREYLSFEECSKADKFYFEPDRNHFTVARAMLRAILGRYLEIHPKEIQFRYQKHGKPELDDSLLKCDFYKVKDLRFNLSHSGGLALCAVTYQREIGVDVEYLGRVVKDLEKIAERFFSPSESARFHLVPQSEKPLAFFRCWTRKEAYIKAIGQGLSFPLDKFDVTFTKDLPPQLLRVIDHPQESSRWTLKEVIPSENYMGAVIAEGSNWTLYCYKTEI